MRPTARVADRSAHCDVAVTINSDINPAICWITTSCWGVAISEHSCVADLLAGDAIVNFAGCVGVRVDRGWRSGCW